MLNMTFPISWSDHNWKIKNGDFESQLLFVSFFLFLFVDEPLFKENDVFQGMKMFCLTPLTSCSMQFHHRWPPTWRATMPIRFPWFHPWKLRRLGFGRWIHLSKDFWLEGNPISHAQCMAMYVLFTSIYLQNWVVLGVNVGKYVPTLASGHWIHVTGMVFGYTFKMDFLNGG